VQKNHRTTLESLLPDLPTDLRSNYTLMHDSRSLQDATLLKPRVILFGKNAKLTCAFNGDSDQAAYDVLECIQFRDSEQAFDFRQIQFPTQQNHLTQVRFSNRGESADGSARCSSCHFEDPRPNWDQYSNWPGAYGEGDDEMGNPSDYAKFVQLRDQHPRYKYLIQGSNPVAPYLQDDTLQGSQRPNLRFSDLISKWNSLRVLRIQGAQLPHWQLMAEAVSLLNCSFTADQQAAIDQAHLDFSVDGNTDQVLGKFGMDAAEWGTDIAADHQSGYDHDGGFGSLYRDIGMGVVQQLARAGDTTLQTVLDQINSGYAANSELVQFGDVDLFQNMGAIIPELYPDTSRTTQICPELVAKFMPEYLQHAAGP
jgi:hypothetical protein